MHDYHPWVFGLLAETDHTGELGHVAKAQLTRQALTGRAVRPSTVSGRRERMHLQYLFGGVTGYS